MDYKEELFNALEQFLLDNNIYSQFTIYILEHYNISFLEFYDYCFEYCRGNMHHLFYNHWRNLDIHKKWYRISTDIKLKYERGV